MIARAQDKRVWLAGGAALAVLIIVIGWLAVISPQLSSAKTLRGEADSARAQNSVLAAKVAKLKRDNSNVGALKTTLRAALAALPFDSGLPTFTRQVSAQATENGVALTSITLGSAVATTPVATATTPSATTPSATTSTGTTATVPPAAAAAAPTAAMSIPVTLLCKASSKHLLAFVKAIQATGPRRALVRTTTLGSAGAGAGSIDESATMTIQLSIFTAPMNSADRAQLAKLLSAK